MNVNRLVVAAGGVAVGVGGTLLAQKLQRDAQESGLTDAVKDVVKETAVKETEPKGSEPKETESKETIAYREAVAKNNTPKAATPAAKTTPAKTVTTQKLSAASPNDEKK